MEPKQHKFLVLAIIWTVLITYLSIATVNNIKVSIAIPNKDKIGHFVFYFVFVITWILYFKNRLPSSDAKFIVVIAIGYGIVMEAFQYWFTSNRNPDGFDVLANSIGAIAGFQFFKLSKKIFYTKISR